ncbi:MAG: chloride channel protein [Hyphomicrobiales bacterium]|nr:chloride channel protein [Hyphomicrobiales bacterium]
MTKPNPRRRRHYAGWLSRRLWRRRLVFWLGAIAVGLLSVIFAEAANWSQAAFAIGVAQIWWLPFAVTPLGFLVCAYLARTFFPGSQGSGIPQAIAARHLRSSADRAFLLSPKLIVAKIGLTVLGLLMGASVGREGPTVQVGAAIMLEVASWGGLRHARGLILTGSAAGIAAAFNTPLAGIVFAIEEMSRSFEQRTNGLVLYAVIIAALISLGLVGNYSYFGFVTAAQMGARDWGMVLACGVVGGLAGGLFSRLLFEGSRLARRWTSTSPRSRSLSTAFVCGLIVAIVGVYTDGATFGTGYEQARSAVEGHALASIFWPAKFVATIATALSGIPGGIFAPSLAVGAGLGGWLGTLAGTSGSGLAAVLGMAGYFAGVVQAPMTAFVIILEMTGNGANVIPLMVAAAIGFGTSKLVAPEPLYHALANGFIQDACDQVEAANANGEKQQQTR